MKKNLLTIIILTLFLPPSYGNTSDRLLSELDNLIDSASYFEKVKTTYISNIHHAMHAGRSRLTQRERYEFNMKFFTAYESYICDSAMKYIDRNIGIARRLDDKTLLNTALIYKAGMLGKSGLYIQGLDILKNIDRRSLNKAQLSRLYCTLADICLFLAEYADGTEYARMYIEKLHAYRDSVLQVEPKGSYTYVITCAPQLLDSGQTLRAEKMLLRLISGLRQDSRQYAVTASILAFLYKTAGNSQKYKEYLTLSAMADIRGVVKENQALRTLAEILFKNGDLVRADRYMKRSMEDANFFNARLRNVQAARMLPVIDHAHEVERQHSLLLLKVSLLVITLLALFLLAAVWYVRKQMHHLSEARSNVVKAYRELQTLNAKLVDVNNAQQETNARLNEANMIKEVYVGHFLSLCSSYINKLDDYRRMLNRLATANKREELLRTLKSSGFVNQELKDFYNNFDDSFLKIFPNFVQRFNSLLPPEDRILPHRDERLTTELRIFALIRLGITDSHKIASFLNYSITTIYTYRSKMKKRALNKASFEEDVMRIGSFSN